MPFKMALSPKYRAEVEVVTPNEQGGIDESKFWAEFKRCEIDELVELRKMPQIEAIKRVLVGWSELLDGESQQVPFSDANRDALFRIPQAVAALVEAFWDSVYKAREKNLSRPSGA